VRVVWVALAVVVGLVAPGVAQARSGVVRDGGARFEVITPSLIRAEYAEDVRFEDAPTQTTGPRAARTPPHFTTWARHGWRTIKTSALTLRYRRASGAFTKDNLRLIIRIAGRRVTVTPTAGPSKHNLGGWTRALDNLSGPVPLNDGLLSRDGWFVLDDTNTVLLTGNGFAQRPERKTPYQDWYLFAYGDDYARGLKDLRALTGPAPLLPRRAFGVWFSRYYPYSESDLEQLAADFRAHNLPLDVLSIDTDFKRVADPVGGAVAAAAASVPGTAYSWNAWQWNTTLFPDPKRLVDWAHGEGIDLAVNIHPTINTNDPRYAATTAKTGPLASDDGQCKLLQADITATCKVFDWTNPRQLAAYLDLHDFVEKPGIDMLWLDWCCDGPQKTTPGLTNDAWINARYAARQRKRGQRWPAFSRIGGTFVNDGVDGDRTVGNGGAGAFAEHRSTIQFTGDTCATWPMLRFEAQVTASEGNIGLPYVSHDIGSFNGTPVGGACSSIPAALLSRHLPDDLYARWVQLGTFQPLDRLHSNHGDRLPWEYGQAAHASALQFLRLRAALVPYTYALARRAHDSGLPMAGALYLQWPREPGAYEHPSQHTFGPNVVVAPVSAPGDPAPATIWVPPGTWVDYFTGATVRGPKQVTVQVPLDRMPVLVRAGAIIPTGVPDHLTLTVYRGKRGTFTLYEDEGRGFGYERGRFTRTKITHDGPGVTIAAARGTYPGAPRTRSWTVRFIGGQTVETGPRSTSRPLTVKAR
jgi:alpha-glucosidase (family GH31 glycosyl hydrolase)